MGWLGHGAIAVIALSSSALGTTATFDDLAADALQHAVPDGYRGLTWTNFFYQRASALSGSGAGFANGLISGDSVGYSDAFMPTATISSPTPFTFSSAYLTAARTAGLQIEVKGLNGGGAQLFDRVVTVDPTAASQVVFNWAGVSSVVFAYQSDIDFGRNFVVDDLVVNAADPAAAPLPGVGWAGVALCAGVLAKRIRPAARAQAG